MSKATQFIFTCEHAHAKVPGSIKDTLKIPKKILESHWGYDPGALQMTRFLARQLDGHSFEFPWSRLVIDANRSLQNPKVFSSWSQNLDEQNRKKMLRDYLNYRSKIENTVSRSLKTSSARVTLFSVHSFTPVFKGKNRKTDLGLLFRPWVEKEKHLAEHLRKAFRGSGLAVHFNLPYRGFTDCLLNDILDQYLKSHRVNGCFLEINQKLLTQKSRYSEMQRRLKNAMASY